LNRARAGARTAPPLRCVKGLAAIRIRTHHERQQVGDIGLHSGPRTLCGDLPHLQRAQRDLRDEVGSAGRRARCGA
jgi:hypothetical protein